ncbi:putative surface protease GP63, partial [Trypanosoma conorhini]
NEKLLCTHDRLSLGNCDFGRYKQPLSAAVPVLRGPQAWRQEGVYGLLPARYWACGDGCTNGKAHAIVGSFIGPNSRCVKGNDLQVSGKPIGDVCVNTQCDGGRLKVQFRRDAT